jgi:chorismate-pyruvate lyase
MVLLWSAAVAADDRTPAARPVPADDRAPARTADWPGSYLSRVEALALIQTLNAELLSHDSATLTLEHWCGTHRLASPPRIVAERVPGADKPPSPEQRRELGIAPAEAVRYRRVRLLCGDVVLSEAENWYVPARLTPDMNKLLDTTDLPFGRVVQALHFRRHTLSSTLLWSPLPEGWEMNAAAVSAHGVSAGAGVGTTGRDEGGADMSLPPALLEHRAVLSLPDGTPFSEVVETYTGNILAFPRKLAFPRE